MTGSDQTGKFHGYTKQLCWDTFIKSNSVTLDDFIQLGRAYLSQDVNFQSFIIDIYCKNKVLTNVKNLD